MSPTSEVSSDVTRETAGADVRYYVQVFTARKWWLLGSLAAGLLLTLAYNAVQTPVYEGRTTLLIDTGQRTSRRGDDDILWSLIGIGRARTLGTQIEIVKSRSGLTNASRIVAARWIVEAAIAQSEAAGEVAREGSGPLAELPKGLVSGTDADLLRALGRLHREAALAEDDLEKLVIRDALPEASEGKASYPPGLDEELEAQVSAVLSPAKRTRLTQGMQSCVPAAAEKCRRQLVGFSVQGVRETDVIAITCDSPSPRLAAAYADAIAQEYVWRSLLNSQEAARRGADWVATQVEDAQHELDRAGEQVRVLLSESGLASVPDAARTLTERVSALSDSAARTRASVQADEAQLATLRRASAEQRQAVVVSSTSLSGGSGEEVRKRLVDAQEERASLLEKVTEKHPSVAEVDARIEALERQLADELGRRVESETQVRNPLGEELLKQAVESQVALVSDQAQLAALESAVGRAQEELARIPEVEQRLAQAQRELDIADKDYLALRDTEQSLKLAKETQAAGASILDESAVPTTPYAPNERLNLVAGLLLGLILGVGLALLVDHLDNTVKDAEELERTYGLPTLAIIPRFRGTEVIMRESNEPDWVSPEPYRTLRSNIRFAAAGADLKCLVVTSPAQGEGKTTTAINLSIVCGQMDGNVVLLDTDLRRSSVAEQMALPKEPGVTNLVIGDQTLEQALQPSPYEGLQVLAAGPPVPNALQVLESARMRSIVEDLREATNLVILDSPPAALLADAQALASLADGLVLVVELGHTRHPALAHALDALRRTGTRCLGVVVNKAASGRRGYGHYHYYYEQGHRHDDPGQSPAEP